MFAKRNNYNGANVNQKKNFDYLKQRRDTECFRCGRRGHLARDCRVKNVKKPINNNKQSARQVVRDNDDELKSTMLLSNTEKVLLGEEKKSTWCIDSGCTGHMCNKKEIIRNFTKVNSELNLANSERTHITGTGKVCISVDTGSEERQINIENVFYVSDLRTNLLSVAKMTDRGYEVHFRRNDAIVIDENSKIHMRADRVGNLYHVRMNNNVVNNIEKVKNSIDKWHQRLGHLNERDLKKMTKDNMVYGLNFKDSEELSECEICISEKQTCTPFPKGSSDRTSELLEIVHTDVCGPMRHESFSGKKYFVTFIDDKSRWCEVYFIRNKSDVLSMFKIYKAYVEKFTGKKIKHLQSDNGREFVNKEFDDFMNNEGIARRLTAPYTPQQNGIAERKNRTLVEMARCMMRQAGSPPSFWAEAINTANYVRNRCPTKALNGEIPFTMWKGKRPTLIYMQVFGSKAYYKDKGSSKGKFDPRSEIGTFVGYDNQSKAYRIHDPKTRKIVITRDVKFMNETAFEHEYKEILDEDDSECESEKITINIDMPNNENKRKENNKLDKRNKRKRKSNVMWEELINPTKRTRGRPKIIRTGMVGRPRKEYKLCATDVQDEEYEIENDNKNEMIAGIATIEPITWNEIEGTNEEDAWRIALENEYLAHIKNKTWEIVPRPKHRKVIGNRFVFSTKSTGKKIRLVAKGCSQRPGEDFHETSSPVVRSSSIRVIAAIAAELGLEIHQMDVVTAYLNGTLEEEVFMEIPDKLQTVLSKVLENQKNGTQINILETAKRWDDTLYECNDCVCLLKKSLYGLRQSGLQWHKELVSKLKDIDFKAMPQDPCVFVASKNERIMLIVIYVDDIILATNDSVWMNDVKLYLCNSFEMKDLGKINNCLGIEFTRDSDNRVYLSQKSYLVKILDRFGMNECKPTMTPIDVDVKLEKPEFVDCNVMKQYPYQSLIGALMYLAVTTRPDIAFTVNYLSQFNTNYNIDHWKAAKRVLRYLKGTSDYGLMYERTGLPLFGVADADWGANSVDRRSYSGFALILAGAPISWEARKQRCVALSSTEAEYIALAEAAKEAMYMRDVLSNVGMDYECVTLFNDNQGAIKIAQNKNYRSRTKHIDVRHHFIKDLCEQNVIELQYLSTDLMPADVLTKGLGRLKHHECLNNLGMINLSE